MQVELGLQTGLLFAVPIPEDKAGDSELIRASIDKALQEANEKGVQGAEITPFLLKRVSELSEGNSSEASKLENVFNWCVDVELIKNNAALGAQIAVAMSAGK